MLLWILLERRFIKKKMLCLFFMCKVCGRCRLRVYIYCWFLVFLLYLLSVFVFGKCLFYMLGWCVDWVWSGIFGDSCYVIVSVI